MPPADSQPPRGSRQALIAATILVLGAIGIGGYEFANHQHQDSSHDAINTNLAGVHQSAPVQVSNALTGQALKPAAPGTLVSVAEVLDKVDKWMAEHPNYHVYALTSFPNGSVVGKMDVYAYTNESKEAIVAMKADLSAPQSVHFEGVKRNGKLQVYFPASDQLVQPDTTKSLASMPVLAGNPSGAKVLLKLARSSFAEASADMEVATLVFDTQALNMRETSGDIYLSIRINNQGQLLGIEEQAQGQRILTTMKYLSFDRDAIIHDAPVLPAGKLVVTNKSFEQAMKEEVRLVINQPLRTKI